MTLGTCPECRSPLWRSPSGYLVCSRGCGKLLLAHLTAHTPPKLVIVGRPVEKFVPYR